MILFGQPAVVFSAADPRISQARPVVFLILLLALSPKLR